MARSFSIFFDKDCQSQPTDITQLLFKRALSMKRRQEITEVARKHQLVIIEDDVYGLCIEPRQTLIAALYPEGTIFLISLSKSVAPGLCIGCLACPERLAGRASAPHAIRIALGAPHTFEDAIRAAEELGRLLVAGPMALDLAV